MEEYKIRSILKTLTWRITASLDTFVIAWIIIGEWGMGASIAGFEVITKTFFFIFTREYGIKLIPKPSSLIRDNSHKIYN